MDSRAANLRIDQLLAISEDALLASAVEVFSMSAISNVADQGGS